MVIPAWTVSVVLPLTFANDAEIVELPPPEPVAKPEVLIVATVVFEEAHVASAVTSRGGASG